MGYYAGPSACFTAQTRRIPPGSRDLEAVRRPFEIDVLVGRKRPRALALVEPRRLPVLSGRCPHQAGIALAPLPPSEPGVQIFRTGLPKTSLELARLFDEPPGDRAAGTMADCLGRSMSAGTAGSASSRTAPIAAVLPIGRVSV